jgi:CheY-like chemotaxis protein
MLRELGYGAVGIASAAKALEILQAGERPDLAILDDAMPEMTGAALAKRVRETCPGLPLFLATGYSDQVKTGVDLPKLAKPFTIVELAVRSVRSRRAGFDRRLHRPEGRVRAGDQAVFSSVSASSSIIALRIRNFCAFPLTVIGNESTKRT